MAASSHTHTFTQETPVEVSARRMWEGFLADSHRCLPRAIPHTIRSVDYEGGEARARSGTLRIITFHEGHPRPRMKQRIVEMEEEKMTAEVEIVEGGFLGVAFRAYRVRIEFREGVVGWCVEYIPMQEEDCEEMSPPMQQFIHSMVSNIKRVEAYLLANPHLYA